MKSYKYITFVSGQGRPALYIFTWSIHDFSPHRASYKVSMLGSCKNIEDFRNVLSQQHATQQQNGHI